MKKKLSYICVLFFHSISIHFGYSQQSTIIGHQELVGYYNPSLVTGSRGQVSYLYRYQWEGLGPSSNTLFFKYPLKRKENVFHPRVIGSIFQYENFNIVNTTKLEFFTSNILASIKEFDIGLGLNLGVGHRGLNTNDFDVEELVDPELANIDNNFFISNKLGLSIHHRLVDIGFASRILNIKSITDHHSFLSFNALSISQKMELNPMVVFRMTKNLDYQVEGQLKFIYSDKVSMMAGYRQNFGAIFQFGIKINESYEGSYGLETPRKGATSLGFTHELYGSYYFESPSLVQHRKDSIIKVRRDSLNEIRVEKYMRQQQEEMAKNDSLSLLQVSEKDSFNFNKPDMLDSVAQDVIAEEIDEDTNSFYDNLEDLSGNVSDNTHVILNHIGFEPDLYLLTPDSYRELDKLFNYIKHHKSLHIEIQGHTDNSGSAETNLILSRYRALTVYNYLVSQGIDPARINVIGYGENKPLYPNDTKENRELNRRIEIVFIKK